MVTTEFEQLQQGEHTLDGPTDDEGVTAAERVDRRQLLLVACCLVTLLVAAVLAPTPVAPDVPTPPATDTPTPTPRGSAGGGGGGDGGGDSRVVGGEGDPVPIPGGDAPPTDGCAVLLEDEPIPGANATVAVFRDSEPVPAVAVRFNGERVGRTDKGGRVSGPVPYNRTLAVSVDLDDDCGFYRERFDEDEEGAVALDAGGTAVRGGSPSADAGPGRNGVSTSKRATVESLAEMQGRSVRGLVGTAPVVDGFGPTVAPSAATTQSANSTGVYGVSGTVSLTVRGDAYPGSTVTVIATIEGVPMREATVTLDGSTVGRTDDGGGADLTVPDGNQTVPFNVSRGDFEGQGAIDVLLLTAAVQPREGFPVPGERAAVVTRIDERPTGDVSVRVAGRPRGETAADGQVGFRLPMSPGGTAVAHTSRQSTTVSLWRVYVPTVLNLFVLLVFGVVATGGTRLLRGPHAATHVGIAWAALAVADVALIVGELLGLGLAVLGMAAVGAVRQRRRVQTGGERAAGAATTVVMTVRRCALWVTDLVARAFDRFEALLGRTFTRLTSFEHFAAWLAGLVGRVVTTVWLYLTLRRVGFAVFALAELAVATTRWGHEGLIASVAGLGVLAAIIALLGRDDYPTTPTDPDDDSETTRHRVRRAGEHTTEETEEPELSIRELWRRFARWVVPGSWRTRTPGEVSRAAVDRGFPREPVEALTDAFRDVEYGSEAATTRREQAKAAFDSLAAHGEEDDE